jgi:phage gpG-like protein
MSLTYKDNDLGLKDLKKRLKEFKRSTIKVGIQNNAGINKGKRIVDYAANNEFGVLGHIPERSFIRSTADKNKNWADEIDNAYISVIDKGQRPLAAIARVGIIARDAIVQTITDGVRPENSPFTIKKKGSSKTLIDTGVLRKSIQYKFDENI